MPSSAWFAFKQMVRQLKKDYPSNFMPGPFPEITDRALLTWDSEGYFRILFPCDGKCALGIFAPGKVHRHIKDGLWYVVVTPSLNEVQTEVVS